jgi:iduronate 2-sulfatase
MILGAPMLALAKPTRRNLLFIASDDLNHSMSTFGNELVPTPNLDRIARRGVRFDRAYCQFAFCSPSRTSLMTGLSPDRTGVYNLTKHFRETVPNVVTLGQLFQKNGYHAARVGKIYHYGNPGQIGTDGLDDAPTWNQRVNPRGIDKDEEKLLTNYTPTRGVGSALAYYASPGRDEEHTDGKVAGESIRILEENQKRPFFLGAGFYKPHCPFIAPAKYFDRVPIDAVKALPFEEWEMNIAPKWAYFTRPANWDLTEKQRVEVIRAYYATILFLDAQIGRVLDAMEKMKLAEKTTIVFWSDHGYHLGEHGQWMKQTVFEGAARTPMMISGAGVKARGKRCARPVELLDLYPTVAELCELEGRPTNLHGTSLRKLLDDPQAKWERPAMTQVERPNQGKPVMGYSIRNERYRYTMWNAGAEGEELYDYAIDPRELKNLSGEASSAGVKAGLRTELERMIENRRK